jgi:hypothetical protein
MGAFRSESDALLAILLELRKNILSYELRCALLSGMRQRSERMLAEMASRADTDPHKALAKMLWTAAMGTKEDEFTTPKLDAIQGALVVLGASAIGPGDIESVRTAMLWAGLLGYGYSGGKRATVDGKY